MKRIFLQLILVTAIANGTPPTLSYVHAALHEIDSEIKPDHYEIATANLNDDGTDDALVLMNGKSAYCGSGGATMFIFKGNGFRFEPMGSIKVVNAPIFVRKTSHNGFHDLLVTVRGGGAVPGLSALQFDGKQYPPSPGEARVEAEETDKVLFAKPADPFDKTQELQGISFHVSSPNNHSGNLLTITPKGLETDNTPIETNVVGIVTGMELADINVDGSPEIYIYIFDGSSQTLLAWSANNRRSLSQITLPDLADHSKGYRGGDEFAVVESVIARRFAIYPENNQESKPTGKMRQIQYKLHKGEASWLLKVDRVTEF